MGNKETDRLWKDIQYLSEIGPKQAMSQLGEGQELSGAASLLALALIHIAEANVDVGTTDVELKLPLEVTLDHMVPGLYKRVAQSVVETPVVLAITPSEDLALMVLGMIVYDEHKPEDIDRELYHKALREALDYGVLVLGLADLGSITVEPTEVN